MKYKIKFKNGEEKIIELEKSLETINTDSNFINLENKIYINKDKVLYIEKEEINASQNNIKIPRYLYSIIYTNGSSDVIELSDKFDFELYQRIAKQPNNRIFIRDKDNNDWLIDPAHICSITPTYIKCSK